MKLQAEENKKIKVLIISKFFSPERSIAAVRWTKISKYLNKLGNYEITVLTETRNFDKEDGLPIKIQKDELLEKDLKYIKENLEVPISLPLKLMFSIRNRIQRNRGYTESLVYIQETKKTGQNFLKKNFVLFIKNLIDYLWAKSAINYLKKNQEDWDVVISSAGPLWVIKVAEYVKKVHKILWIADFRDNYPSILNTKLFFEIEKSQILKHCKKVDIVFRVNETMMTGTDNAIRTVTVTNGFDSEEKREPLAPSKFNIIYTGSLYYATKVEPLFRAVNDLIMEKKILKEDISIDFYGGRKHFIDEQVNATNAVSFYQHHGFVSRKVVIEQQQNAAILLQMGENTNETKAVWSGKMYEYMMSGKPIVFLVSGNLPYSIPSQYMKKLGGYCYEECRDSETYEGLKSFIFEKYIEWKRTGNVSVLQDDVYINQYSYSEISKRIINIIEAEIKNEKRIVKEN